MTYLGRDIRVLSREELIEALERTAIELNETRKSASEMNRTWAVIARATGKV